MAMFRNERVLSSKPGRVQIEPQHDSVTNCAGLVLIKGSSRECNSYVLHSTGERIVTLLESSVDVVFAGDLVAHLDALIEEDLVGFLDLFFGVVGDHYDGLF
jgi:hypothetical protein